MTEDAKKQHRFFFGHDYSYIVANKQSVNIAHCILHQTPPPSPSPHPYPSRHPRRTTCQQNTVSIGTDTLRFSRPYSFSFFTTDGDENIYLVRDVLRKFEYSRLYRMTSFKPTVYNEGVGMIIEFVMAAENIGDFSQFRFRVR